MIESFTDRGTARSARRAQEENDAHAHRPPTYALVVENRRGDWVADWFADRVRQVLAREGSPLSRLPFDDALSTLRRVAGSLERDGYPILWQDSFEREAIAAGFVVNEGGVLVVLREE